MDLKEYYGFESGAIEIPGRTGTRSARLSSRR
jgi:hypothetical protein